MHSCLAIDRDRRHHCGEASCVTGRDHRGRWYTPCMGQSGMRIQLASSVGVTHRGEEFRCLFETEELAAAWLSLPGTWGYVMTLQFDALEFGTA